MSLSAAIDATPATPASSAPASGSSAPADSGVAIAPASGGTSAEAGAPASGKPEGIPDAFWNAEKNAFNVEKLTELSGVAEKFAKYSDGAVDDPSKVDFKALISGLKGEDGQPLKDPAGNVIELDDKSPLLQSAAKIFAEYGMGKAAQASLIRAFVESQIADAKSVMEAGMAEKAKLGEKADERINALRNFMQTKGGDGAAALLSRMNTAEEFEALEKIVALVTGPAAGANAGNTPPPQDAVSILFPNARRAS